MKKLLALMPLAFAFPAGTGAEQLSECEYVIHKLGRVPGVKT